MTSEQIKARIFKKKHKTVSAFARTSKLDRTWLQITLRPGRTLKPEEAKLILDRLETAKVEDLSIPEDKLELFKSKIQEAGGIYKFAQDNPQFTKRHVYSVYNGGFSMKSGTVKKLFKFLKIK